MNVQIISHTSDIDNVVAMAAKTCYSSNSTAEILESLNNNTESRAKFIKMLKDMGHESPLEHASITFSIEGVSRTLLAQLTRHRIASYSVKSQRYVDESTSTLEESYITPPEISKDEKLNEIYKNAMSKAYESYTLLALELMENYTKADPDGNKNSHLKKAIEDARFVLPNSWSTTIIMTMNVRALYNLFSLRTCSRAQWEIRQMCALMLEELIILSPTLFEGVGPDCLTSRCGEGKMTCGKPIKSTQEFIDTNKNL